VELEVQETQVQDQVVQVEVLILIKVVQQEQEILRQLAHHKEIQEELLLDLNQMNLVVVEEVLVQQEELPLVI
jgi:hypothetical protein